MLHNHLHHMQVWYHKGSNYDADIQVGFHLAKMRSYYWSFYIRVWCSGVVIWCGDLVGCSHFWPIYLSVTELFGDFDAIDIKYQFFLCHHFLFFFRYLFCKRVTDLYRNWNFSKIFKIFLSERTSKYSFLRCSPPYLNFLVVKYLQIDKHWRYYYDTNFG